MVTKVKSASLTVADKITRSHFTCRLRSDLIGEVKKNSIAFNCSQGVLLEVMIAKAVTSGLVTQRDVYAYSHDPEWLQRLISDSIDRLSAVSGSLDPIALERLTKLLAKSIPTLNKPPPKKFTI